MFSRFRSRTIRFAGVAVVVAGTAMFNSTTHASAALANQCNPSEFCTAVAQTIPFGSGEELIALACNATVEPLPNDVVTQTSVECWIADAAGNRLPGADTGVRTAPDGLPADATGLPGPFLVAPYQVCIQASWSGVQVVGSGTVAFGPSTPICSFGPF